MRPRIWEAGRRKIAQSRPTEKPLQPAMGLADQLLAEGEGVTIVRRFPGEAAWTELWQEADGQSVELPGGTLNFFPTPAMLLIDIDGQDDPVALAKTAIEPLACTFRRFDLGGNIGIDFPTISDKAERKRIDAALEEALSDWPHERTAMNGFGFVQIVARLERPSLLNHINHNRASAKARNLLRQAERIDEPGCLLLHCVDWVAKAIKEEWLAELSRRTGREVRVEIDKDKVAIEYCFAQAVPL
jgi:ribonuclease G